MYLIRICGWKPLIWDQSGRKEMPSISFLNLDLDLDLDLDTTSQLHFLLHHHTHDYCNVPTDCCEICVRCLLLWPDHHRRRCDQNCILTSVTDAKEIEQPINTRWSTKSFGPNVMLFSLQSIAVLFNAQMCCDRIIIMSFPMNKSKEFTKDIILSQVWKKIFNLCCPWFYGGFNCVTNVNSSRTQRFDRSSGFLFMFCFLT